MATPFSIFQKLETIAKETVQDTTPQKTSFAVLRFITMLTNSNNVYIVGKTFEI